MKSIVSLVSILFLSHAHANDSLNQRLDQLELKIEELKEQGQLSNKLSIGGYGEITYTNKRSELQNGQKATHSSNPQTDALRNVLYIGYKFDNQWSLTTEIEVEHADEIFLEQGFLNYRNGETFNWQSGVLLIPMGIVNKVHEPNTFLAVSRSETESKIIPTTWREVGTGVHGKLNNFSYEIDLVTGLLASGFSSTGVRSGRQKASQSEARDLAWVAQLKYSLMSGLELGTSHYIGKAGGVRTDVKHRVHDLFITAEVSGFKFKTMYAISKLDNTLSLNQEKGLTGANAIASEMNGGYAELGYNVFHGKKQWALIPFVRYETLDTQKKLDSGFTKNLANKATYTTFGISTMPNQHVVLKADYTKYENKAKTGHDTWKLGLGWLF